MLHLFGSFYKVISFLRIEAFGHCTLVVGIAGFDVHRADFLKEMPLKKDEVTVVAVEFR